MCSKASSGEDLIQEAMKYPLTPEMMAFKDVMKFIYNDIYKYNIKGDVIATVSTTKAMQSIESFLSSYVNNSKFREQIDSYLRKNVHADFPRLIAVTAQKGIDHHTYSWIQDILSTSKICHVTKTEGLQVYQCADDIGAKLMEFVAPTYSRGE